MKALLAKSSQADLALIAPASRCDKLNDKPSMKISHTTTEREWIVIVISGLLHAASFFATAGSSLSATVKAVTALPCIYLSFPAVWLLCHAADAIALHPHPRCLSHQCLRWCLAHQHLDHNLPGHLRPILAHLHLHTGYPVQSIMVHLQHK